MKMSKVIGAYEKNQSKLWYLPLILLVLAVLFLGVNYVQTGDFMNKDISLRGGIVGTIDLSGQSQVYQPIQVASDLEAEYADISFDVSQTTSRSEQVGIIVESTFETSEQRESFITYLTNYFSVDISEITVEQTESSFGTAFFLNLLLGVVVSFVLMAGVVYLTFRKWYPSALVIFAVFSDIIITLAIVTLFGIKISGAGIAAFLMIIGYAVDTNILLSYKVLRNHDKSPFERVIGAAKTGLLMSGTTFAAMIAALIVTNSVVIFQILFILTAALVVDMLNTWLLNAYLLQKYVTKVSGEVEKKQTRGKKK